MYGVRCDHSGDKYLYTVERFTKKGCDNWQRGAFTSISTPLNHALKRQLSRPCHFVKGLNPDPLDSTRSNLCFVTLMIYLLKSQTFLKCHRKVIMESWFRVRHVSYLNVTFGGFHNLTNAVGVPFSVVYSHKNLTLTKITTQNTFGQSPNTDLRTLM